MRLIRDMYNDLDAFGRFWFALGLGALAAAAAMSFDFGWGVSMKHALFLAVLTVVAAFGPMASEMLFSRGRKGPAIATALLCVPLLAIEFYSHAGYTAGLRGTNIETATVQNAKWTGAQEAVSEDKQNVALWKQQLATLLEQNAWAGTVKAEGLRSELKTLETRVEEEKKGKRGRKAGCGAECERLQNAANALRTRIATIEQADDLSRRIEATQRIIDGKRETAATTEHKSSAVDHQNKFLVKTVALFVNGSTTASDLQAMGAEQSVNLAMAIAGTGLPAFALFMAGLFRSERRRNDDDLPPSASAPVAAPKAPDLHPVSPAPRATLSTTTVADLRRMAFAA